jgi:hypothetical protein
MKKGWMICLVLVTLVATSAAGESQTEARGFDTPAACAQAVYEALQSNDISAAEECFAIPEMARLFDFRKFCERLQCVPGMYTYLPSSTELGVAYNEASLRSMLYHRIAFSSYLLADYQYGQMVNSYKTYAPLSEDVYNLISFLETPSSAEGFTLLTLDGIVTPDTFERYGALYTSEINVRNRGIQMSMWAVEDNQELVLILSGPESLLNGDKLIMPLRLVQVGGKWLADPTGTNFGAILGINTYNLFTLLSAM